MFAFATVSSRTINYVNYIFSHEYYMITHTIKAPAKVLVYVKIIIEIWREQLNDKITPSLGLANICSQFPFSRSTPRTSTSEIFV